ncbi:MAG: hypothetical protein A4E19_13910 [Nitrospira sp. SG-bin1]|nr:MAG: hypothetical protein A4E19_13910 [Nitrospira sp. SG-bin1]
MDRSGDQSQAEYYGLIRGQIEHHDQLINQRVTWQIITQAFFFGAYATLLNAQKEAKNPLFEAEQLLLLWLLPVAGLLAGALAYVSIIASLKNIDHLRALYENFAQSKTPEDASTKLYPHIQGPAYLTKWAKLTPMWMPVVFTTAWLIILGRLTAAFLLI